MGSHHRHLADDNFTGEHLRGSKSHNPGAAPALVSWRTGLVIASLTLLALAIANGIGH